VQYLLEARLYLKPEKCKFHKNTVKYLRMITLMKGVSIDQHKVERLQSWSRENETANERLNNLSDVHQYLYFCNYY